MFVRVAERERENRETDRDGAKDRGRVREREVRVRELWEKLKYIHTVGSVACVYVSALGNWSHKSNLPVSSGGWGGWRT